MRINTLSIIIGAAILLTTIMSYFLAALLISNSRTWDHRINLANASYFEHLKLQGNIQQLVSMQFSVVKCFNESSEKNVVCPNPQQQITENIAKIRSIIAAEISLVGESEAEELQLIARIESGISFLIQAIPKIDVVNKTNAQNESYIAEATAQVSLLSTEIERLITESLTGENAEVLETKSKAEAYRSDTLKGMLFIVSFSVFISFLSVAAYIRLIASPLVRLSANVKAFRNGNSTANLHVGGVAETRELNLTINDLLARVVKNETNQQRQQELLEVRVGERTHELQRALTKMEQAEEQRRRLIADVSHELRTPLTIIHGEADISLRMHHQSTVESNASFKRIRDTTKHATQILNDLLLIARQESGNLHLDMQVIDLCAIVQETVELFQFAVATELSVLRAEIRGDQLRVRQCLLALVQNARKYGGEKIWIKVEHFADNFVVRVEDNGVGINNADKLHAFERFFRGAGSYRSEVNGDRASTGLGLPIAQAIVLAHGGTVELQDRLGGGLSVVINFRKIDFFNSPDQ